jgi:hypothetical protein
VNKFYVWLAHSPLATAARFALGATLSWFLANPNELNLPVPAAIAIGAALPVLIRWVNPEDVNYGSLNPSDFSTDEE